MSAEVTVEVDIDDYVDVISVKDADGNECDYGFSCTTEGDVSVTLDGYVVDGGDYARLRMLDLIDTE